MHIKQLCVSKYKQSRISWGYSTTYMYILGGNMPCHTIVFNKPFLHISTHNLSKYVSANASENIHKLFGKRVAERKIKPWYA